MPVLRRHRRRRRHRARARSPTRCGRCTQAGLPAEAALAAASWGARAWLGLPCIEEGAPADVVVYDTDPPADLDTLQRPQRMVLRGRVVGLTYSLRAVSGPVIRRSSGIVEATTASDATSPAATVTQKPAPGGCSA